jgi:hypothetical protein
MLAPLLLAALATTCTVLLVRDWLTWKRNIAAFEQRLAELSVDEKGGK